MFTPSGFENKLSPGKRGAGLDSPFATVLLVALPDSSSLLAVTPSIVRGSILYVNVIIVYNVFFSFSLFRTENYILHGYTISSGV
jgi:hypothetical protein